MAVAGVTVNWIEKSSMTLARLFGHPSGAYKTSLGRNDEGCWNALGRHRGRFFDDPWYKWTEGSTLTSVCLYSLHISCAGARCPRRLLHDKWRSRWDLVRPLAPGGVAPPSRLSLLLWSTFWTGWDPHTLQRQSPHAMLVLDYSSRSDSTFSHQLDSK